MDQSASTEARSVEALFARRNETERCHAIKFPSSNLEVLTVLNDEETEILFPALKLKCQWFVFRTTQQDFNAHSLSHWIFFLFSTNKILLVALTCMEHITCQVSILRNIPFQGVGGLGFLKQFMRTRKFPPIIFFPPFYILILTFHFFFSLVLEKPN